MFIVRATKKLRDRLGPLTFQSGERSTTLLGDWYATAWLWRPQVALFVSEATLFPVLVPLAPAATLLKRFPDHLCQALSSQGVSPAFIDQELAETRDARLAPTANRSLLGIMNEFTFLAEHTRNRAEALDATGLAELSGWLASTPCSPLYKRHVSPDRELRALAEQSLRPSDSSGRAWACSGAGRAGRPATAT